MTAAGLQHVEVAGLLIGATVLGRDALAVALTADPGAQLARERALSAHPVLADAGKQLFASGRRP